MVAVTATAKRVRKAKRLPGQLCAEYRRDGKAWTVELKEEPRVHSWGRNLSEARERIYEAAALWFEADPHDIHLRHAYLDLAPETLDILLDVVEARAAAQKAQADAQEATRSAARRLMSEIELSLRDAAEMLQISHTRLRQLLQS